MDPGIREQILSRVTLLEKEQRSMRRQLVKLIVKYNELSYDQDMDHRDRLRHRTVDVDG